MITVNQGLKWEQLAVYVNLESGARNQLESSFNLSAL